MAVPVQNCTSKSFQGEILFGTSFYPVVLYLIKQRSGAREMTQQLTALREPEFGF